MKAGKLNRTQRLDFGVLQDRPFIWDGVLNYGCKI